MKILAYIRVATRALLHRVGFNRELDEEVCSHIQMHADDLERGGLPRKEAERRARLAFGGHERFKEECRDATGIRFIESLGQDLRFGLRMLRKSPAFTAVAIATLALGIGANTAIFSIVNALMLRSLRVQDPQQLVVLQSNFTGSDNEFTNPIWEGLRDHQQSFSGMLAYAPARFDLAAGGESQFADGIWVSGDFFRVLGVPALRGRVFTTNDDHHGGGTDGPVAVISDSFWKSHFGADPEIIGKTIHLNRHPFEIVGVTPPWFTGLQVDRSYDVAIPIGCQSILSGNSNQLDGKTTWWLQIIGRIEPGENTAQATARLSAITLEILKPTLNHPGEAARDSFTLAPASNGFSSIGVQYRTALLTLMATVGLVLLIACANVANLLLARAKARQGEFSVRMAIGAGRRRLIRQLMNESFLLALFGTAGGLLLAHWGTKFLIGMLSTGAQNVEIDASPDARVLVFTALVAIATAFLFGLAPAFRSTRIELNQALRESAPGTLQGSQRFDLSKLLVAGQVAISLLLLLGAGLFLRTLRNILAVDAGFDQHNVVRITADVDPTVIPAAQRAQLFADVLDRIREVPGVLSASSSSIPVISGDGWSERTVPEGFVAKSPRDTVVLLNAVSPGYFQTMKTPLILGRDFHESDNVTSPKVMVVSESTAKGFFQSQDPIGKIIGLGQDGRDGIYQIVGVVKDSKYLSIEEKPRKTAYVVAAQQGAPDISITYEVRTAASPNNLIPSLRAVIAQVNPDISLTFRNFETEVSDSLLQPRLVATLSSVFGALALALSMIGIYGISAYAVERRRSEIGIRIALGADPLSVVRLIMSDVALLLGIGIAAGVAVSLALGHLIGSLLFGIRPNDPVEITGAALALAVAVIVAAFIPARRAAKVDPMLALRHE